MPEDYNKYSNERGMVEMTSPDGKSTQRFFESTVPRQESEGWTVTQGQALSVQTSQGRATMTPESMEGLAMTGTRQQVAPQSVIGEAYDEEQRRQEFEGRTGAALAAGAARGLTFGLLDQALVGTGLVDAETLGGLEEYNPISSAIGEFGSMIAGTVATGGTGVVAKALQKTPAGFAAAKAAKAGEGSAKAFALAQGAESALYGMGHNISQITIHNEPLTADSILVDTLKGGLFAGGMGVAGAAAFKGAGKLYSKGRQALAKKSTPLFDAATDEGHAFLGETTRHLRNSMDVGDNLLKDTNPNRFRITPEELEGQKAWAQYSEGHIDDLTTRLAARRDVVAKKIEMPTKPPVVKKPTDDHLGEIQRLEDELGEAARGPMGTGVPGPEGRAARVQTLDDYMSASREGALDIAAKRHPDIISADLKALRAKQTALEKASKLTGDRAPISKVEYSRYLDDVAKYEADLAEATKKVTEQNLALGAIDDMTDKLAAQVKMSKSSKVTKGRKGVPGNERVTTAADIAHSDVIPVAKKLLGDTDIGDYTSAAKTHLGMANAIADRASTPIPTGNGWGRSEYTSAVKELTDVLGDVPTAASLSKVLNGTPEDVLKFHAAANRHYNAVADLAQVSGNPRALADAQSAAKAMEKFLVGALPKEVSDAAKHLDLSALAAAGGLGSVVDVADGPFDNIAKSAVIYAIIRKGKGGNVGGLVGKMADRTVSSRPGMIGKLFSAGAAGTSRSAVKGNGLIKAGMRSVAGMGGYQASQSVMGKLWNHASLFRASGRANSEAAQAVRRMLKKTAKVSLGGGGAKAALKAIKFNEETEKKHKEKGDDLVSLFKSKSAALSQMAANPDALARTAHEMTAELRGAHPTLGDKVEVGISRAIQHMLDTMPRDPGNQHVMGQSVWTPNAQQIQEWANGWSGVLDPVGTFDGITTGHTTIQAARAVKAAHPSLFAAFQMEVASNAVEIQETIGYDAQNRLSIFMGVPVNSMNTPEYRTFIAEQYASAQTAQQDASKKVDANALLGGVPTQAQQLQNRGAK